MSASRIGSDLSPAQRDWVQFTATTLGGANTAAALIAARTMAIRAIVYAPSTNTGVLQFGPNSSANFRPLPPGGEYLFEAEPQSSFNLAAWFYQSTQAGDALTIIYQPA